jgi:uncharacterized protein YkwD
MMRTGRKLYRAVGVLLLGCLLAGAVIPFLPPPPVHGLWISYRISPWDGMATAERRPEISFQLADFDHTARVKRIELRLDGKVVPAAVDMAKGICFYTPPPLAPGEHTVKVKYELFGYYPSTLETTFTVLNAGTEPFAGRDKEFLARLEADGIAALNRFRAAVAVAELTPHARLGRSAQAHANYLARHAAFTHEEETGRQGYTGVSAWQRAGYFGYFGPVGEGLSRFDPCPALAVDGLIDAPYHRLDLLDPYHREAGIGFATAVSGTGITVLNCGSREMSGEDRVLLYPYPGQADAKAGWYEAEKPNPLRSYGREFIYTGYPVSLSIHGDMTAELEVEEATLEDAAGNKIPCYVVDSSREEEAKTHVFLIPHGPLTFGGTYTASVSGVKVQTNGEKHDFARTWSFRTLARPEIGYAGLETRDGRERFVLRLKNGEFADFTYTLRRGGRVFQTYGRQEYAFYNDLVNGYYELDATCSVFPYPLRTGVEITGPAGGRQVRLLDLAAIPPGALASSGQNPKGDIAVLVDGTPLVLDVSPLLSSGRVLVPLRAIFGALGLGLEWDELARTATAAGPGMRVELPVGSPAARVNGMTVSLDVPATVVNGRTLVPVRFIAESTGAAVEWDEAARTVRIAGQ